MEEVKDTKIAWVQECWHNEDDTISQAITYSYEDDRDQWCARHRLHHKLTKIVWTVYLNKDWEIIEID